MNIFKQLFARRPVRSHPGGATRDVRGAVTGGDVAEPNPGRRFAFALGVIALGIGAGLATIGFGSADWFTDPEAVQIVINGGKVDANVKVFKNASNATAAAYAANSFDTAQEEDIDCAAGGTSCDFYIVIKLSQVNPDVTRTLTFTCQEPLPANSWTCGAISGNQNVAVFQNNQQVKKVGMRVGFPSTRWGNETLTIEGDWT